MPPAGKNKTNFKTYDAATRLLAAVIATNPGIKLDYAELANHVGGGATKAAIDHRLRPTKQLAKMQAAYVRMGKDPGELPANKGEIQKCFGESTPGGLEWQFRDIKSLARAQKQAVRDGANPATLQVTGTPSATRLKNVSASTPSTGRKRKAPTTPSLRVDTDSIEITDDDSDDMKTPTKPPIAKKARTVSVTPSTKLNATVPTTPSASGFDPASGSTEQFSFEGQLSTPRNQSSSTPAPDSFISNVAIKEDPFIGASMSSFSTIDYMEDGEI